MCEKLLYPPVCQSFTVHRCVLADILLYNKKQFIKQYTRYKATNEFFRKNNAFRSERNTQGYYKNTQILNATILHMQSVKY